MARIFLILCCLLFCGCETGISVEEYKRGAADQHYRRTSQEEMFDNARIAFTLVFSVIVYTAPIWIFIGIICMARKAEKNLCTIGELHIEHHKLYEPYVEAEFDEIEEEVKRTGRTDSNATIRAVIPTDSSIFPELRYTREIKRRRK